MTQCIYNLTRYPADFMVREVSGNSSHVCSQTVAQQMKPVPGQLQLFLKKRGDGSEHDDIKVVNPTDLPEAFKLIVDFVWQSALFKSYQWILGHNPR